jgi:hypothetical protein
MLAGLSLAGLSLAEEIDGNGVCPDSDAVEFSSISSRRKMLKVV